MTSPRPSDRALSAFGPPDAPVHWIHAALLGTLFLGSWLAYDRLPERIPTHFGFDGTPDAWSERTLSGWFTLPIVAASVTALMYGCAWLVARYPDSLNVPDGARYRTLSTASKGVVVSHVQVGLLWIGVLTGALFLALQTGTFEVAVGRAERLPWWAVGMIVVVLLGSSLGAVVLIARLSSLVRRLAEAESARSPDT